MDKYSNWLPKLIMKWVRNANGERPTTWAITLSSTTTRYSVAQSLVSDHWRAHEDCHKEQIKRDGVRFYFRYLWQLATKGYAQIDYEVAARAAADKTVAKN